MPLKIIDYNSEEYRQMIDLRDEVLRKPLGLYFNPEDLQREKDDILIGAFEEDKLIGCCLISRENGNTCRLRQMAVSSNLQKKGIGASLMAFAENVARDKGYETLMMHARSSAIGFYEKFGYKTIGNEFYEVTLPHYAMCKNLRY
jgi:N-acetylglutamate synthase-like GNAT family acetyltransferase